MKYYPKISIENREKEVFARLIFTTPFYVVPVKKTGDEQKDKERIKLAILELKNKTALDVLGCKVEYD